MKKKAEKKLILKPTPLFHIFKTIRSTTFVSFSILLITSLCIFLVCSLNYTKSSITSNSVSYTQQLIRQVNSDIDSYIEYMQNLSLMFSTDNDIPKYLFGSGNDSQLVSSLHRENLSNTFSTIMDARNDIYNIGVLSFDGTYFFNDGSDSLNTYTDLKKNEWYNNTIAANGNTVLSSSHVQTLIQGDYQWVITLSKTIQNPDTGRAGGILFIDLNYNAIHDLCKNISLGSTGYIFILDNHGNIIYHPQQQLIYSGLKTENSAAVMAHIGKDNSFTMKSEGKTLLYTFYTSKETGWTVVGVSNMSELLVSQRQTQITYLIILILILFAALILSSFLASSISRPIKTLQSSMKRVETGDFESAYTFIPEPLEIASLSNSYKIMLIQIQKLMKQNVEEQREKRKSELNALQSQINPHFLYNTLDSIIWMAELGQNKEVVLMTSSLAKLLRQSISNNNEIVTISEEINYTRTYLTIQKMRYQDKLDFHIYVNENILHYPIIKLLLQPLVENAIYHGLKYKEGIGNITISGYIKDQHIYLNVEDNGVGMSPEQLEHIFEQKKHTGKSSGMAINNIQRRIQLSYGSEYGLLFESAPGVGTTVRIVIPVQEDI